MPHLPCCNVMQYYLMRNARVYHELLFFIWQKSLVEKNDFIVTEEPIHDE